jgi:hypothetical protein
MPVREAGLHRLIRRRQRRMTGALHRLNFACDVRRLHVRCNGRARVGTWNTGEVMMIKRLVAVCAGAAALIGVASAPAFAAEAENDGPFFATPGSTLVIKISRLLRNDRAGRRERIRFDGYNEHFEGIEEIRRRNGRLFITLSEDWAERNTVFQYRIKGIRRGSGRVTNRSSAFVKIQQRSPNSRPTA